MKEKLLEYQKKINDKYTILEILNWDLKTNTPKDSINNKIEIITSLEEEIFKLQTSDEYKKLLEGFINSRKFSSLDDSVKISIEKTLKKVKEKRKIPLKFNKEYSNLVQKSNVTWEEAKEKKDYKIFEPYLTKLIKKTKEYYNYIDSKNNLYDVMLNEYEEGMNSKIIDKLFTELKEYLIPLIKEIKTKKKSAIKKDCSLETLNECANFLLDYIGFDLNKGTLGMYAHGFTEKIGDNDVRITFSKTNKVTEFISTIIHEGGHGIFEQNVNNEIIKYTGMNLDGIYALHESQSRFFENILGRNINFWSPIYDKVKKILKIDTTLEEFCENLNKVECSLIRTESDEVTYCMHIILRYEIEKDLFEGKIDVKNIPDVWNKKMKEYLGVEVTDDSKGLIQDVHWSVGNFGYFPSYLIGSICDGMLLEAIERDVGKIDEILKKGKIKNITDYFINNIYKYGASYSALEVIEKICKKEISVKPLINYFENKYRKK